LEGVFAGLQCGCQCTECTINGVPSTDIEACNDRSLSDDVLDCKVNNKSLCGPQYSDEEELPLCAIPAPAKWPALYELQGASEAIKVREDQSDEDFGVGNSPPPLAENATVEFIYTATGRNALADAAMAQLIRQPELERLMSNPEIVDSIAVSPYS
jgi:hypothetical protein